MITRHILAARLPFLSSRFNPLAARASAQRSVPFQLATLSHTFHTTTTLKMPEAAGAPVPHEPLVGKSEPQQQQKQQQPKQKQQQQGKATDKKDKKGGGAIAELSPPPEFIAERVKIFDDYMAKYTDYVAKQPRSPITITLPDGKQVEGTAWETTPMDIAKGISTSLADRIIIAKVDNQQLWDLTRPLEKSVSLALLDFDSPENDYEARQVFWHSSAHVMGEACERSFEGCCLGYGPPLADGGFFYDMNLANEKTIGPEDYKQIEEISKKAVKEKQKFERLSLPKEVLLEMFKVSGGILACILPRVIAVPQMTRGIVTRSHILLPARHHALTRSITSTSCTISTIRSLTAPSRRFTVAAHSSTFVQVLTSPTPAALSRLPSRRTRRPTSSAKRTTTRSSVCTAFRSRTRSR